MSAWRSLAIAAAGAYTFGEIRRLRDDQTAISERNRKGSLQLLRIQNDLGSLAVLMRDMADGVEPYPLHGWQPAVDRVRHDLSEATALERTLAPAARDPAQQARLIETMERLRPRLRAHVRGEPPDEASARRMIRAALVPQHRELDGMVSQFLIVNNRIQEEAADANRAVYDQVGREILVLIGALLVVTAIAGAWMFASNRRAFDEVAGISAQLRTLSWRTLRVQEDMQRSIARELHDDFGQILTAIGTLLGRARRQRRGRTADAPLLDELDARARRRAAGAGSHPHAIALAAPGRARRFRPRQGARAFRRRVPTAVRRSACRCPSTGPIGRASAKTARSTCIASRRKR